MLTQWINTHSLDKTLVAAEEYLPYPKARDRSAWNSYNKSLRDEAVRLAENCLNFDWPVLTATQYMEFYRSGSRIASSKPTNARRDALLNLVIGECFEYKGRFIDEIINGIWLICEESTWVVSAHNNHIQNDLTGKHYLPDIENIDIDLFSAETAALLAWTRYMLKDEIDEVTPLVTRRLDYEIKRRIIVPYITRRDFIWLGNANHKVNNWMPWIVSNLLTIFLTMETDPFKRLEAFKKMCAGIDRFIADYGEDGGCDEGTHYWTRAGASLYDCLDQISLATGGEMDFFDKEIVKQIGRYIRRSHIGGKYFVNFADGRPYLRNFCPSLVYLYGKRIGDSGMMRLAKSLNKPYTELHEMSMLRVLPAITCFDEMSGFAEDSDSTAVAPHEILEKDAWLSDLQMLTARQSNSYDGFFFAAKAGHNGESHNHNDVGSFILFIDGLPAIIDVGVETYTRQTFSPERYTIWTMRSLYHNLPIINGCEQLPGQQYKSENVVYQADDAQVSFGADIAGAYGDEAGIESYRREYIFDRDKNKDACLTIRDNYSFRADKNSLAVSFMTWKEPVHKNDGCYINLPNGVTFKIQSKNRVSNVKIEAIDSQDILIKESWGDEGRVYRIIFEPENTGKSGSIEFSVLRA